MKPVRDNLFYHFSISRDVLDITRFFMLNRIQSNTWWRVGRITEASIKKETKESQ